MPLLLSYIVTQLSLFVYMQLLTVATWMIHSMVKWSSQTPQLDQQPTTPAIRATLSAVETTTALVKLMEYGLGAHPLVIVSNKISVYKGCH